MHENNQYYSMNNNHTYPGTMYEDSGNKNWTTTNNQMNMPSMIPMQYESNVPTTISANSDVMNMPETMTNTAYIPAYLRHQIGRWIRVEFLIGNVIEEKVGQLLDVGASYIILKMLEPATTMLCDLYSIKFITIIYDVNLERLYTR